MDAHLPSQHQLCGDCSVPLSVWFVQGLPSSLQKAPKLYQCCLWRKKHHQVIVGSWWDLQAGSKMALFFLNTPVSCLKPENKNQCMIKLYVFNYQNHYFLKRCTEMYNSIQISLYTCHVYAWQALYTEHLPCDRPMLNAGCKECHLQ